LTDHKTELAAIYDDLLSLDLEEGDDLFALHVRLEKTVVRVFTPSEKATQPVVKACYFTCCRWQRGQAPKA
jgi:hypothetical protein